MKESEREYLEDDVAFVSLLPLREFELKAEDVTNSPADRVGFPLLRLREFELKVVGPEGIAPRVGSFTPAMTGSSLLLTSGVRVHD